MKKIMVLAVGVCALVASSVALAAPGNGNGAVTTQFTVPTYNDIYGSGFDVTGCKGVNIYKAGQFNKDNEECTIQGIVAPGTYSVGHGIDGWASDSTAPSHSVGLATLDVTVVITDNGNGTSHESITANYAA